MIRIAIVGGIGSGKTYISNLFGYPVFNADKIVSRIYSSNDKIFYKLKKKLPKFFLNSLFEKSEHKQLHLFFYLNYFQTIMVYLILLLFYYYVFLEIF